MYFILIGYTKNPLYTTLRGKCKFNDLNHSLRVLSLKLV